MNPTRAYISLNNLRFNMENIRKHTNSSKILAAVKADAYGHGAVEVSEFLEKERLADYLGVATTEEGLILRKNNIKLPVLKFTQCFPEELKDILDNNIEIAVYSSEFLSILDKFTSENRKIMNIHIKIDSGMGRVGLREEEFDDFIKILKKCKFINVRGFMTHFAASDSKDHTFTYNQIEIFRKALKYFRNNNIDPDIVHASNSGAVIDFPSSWFDMVRPGIMCYGYYPSNETSEKVPLKPVMTLASRISFIKKVPEKTPVSYGMTYTTFAESHIATIPLGYGDGYNRLLSNRGIVSIKGNEYKISGRVCMDQFMIDIGKNEKEICVGDEVILFGEKDGDSVSLEYLCAMVNTISYELLCNVNKRVPRIYK